MKLTIYTLLAFASLALSTDILSRDPAPVADPELNLIPSRSLKQTSRDQILRREVDRATRTKRDTVGSVIPYPNCNPNQGSTDGLTVFATYVGYDVSGGYLTSGDADNLQGCLAACKLQGGSCQGATYAEFTYNEQDFKTCYQYTSATSVYQVDGNTAGLWQLSCAEAVAAGFPSTCCNSYV